MGDTNDATVVFAASKWDSSKMVTFRFLFRVDLRVSGVINVSTSKSSTTDGSMAASLFMQASVNCIARQRGSVVPTKFFIDGKNEANPKISKSWIHRSLV
jgi:hypothetical protein